jgi:hypothetical protein
MGEGTAKGMIILQMQQEQAARDKAMPAIIRRVLRDFLNEAPTSLRKDVPRIARRIAKAIIG